MVSEVSILIPTFNYDITFLVQQLLDQCQQAAISFEIICLDDASDSLSKNANQNLKFLKNIVYEELPHNISRAAIRNQLAKRARFSYLLFLDNDSRIVSDNFISTYLQAANPQTVHVGGTLYQAQTPEIKYRLHWHYGTHREQRPAFMRQRQPHQQLQVNNLFISRTLYLSNPMSEILQTYGHEDTLWGNQLEKANVPVQHLDNPVLHAGLEPVANFLIKTEQAVNNLAGLIKLEESNWSTSLVRAYRFLEKAQVTFLFQGFFKIIKPLLLLQLKSNRPSLLLFDLYKLGLFVNARKNLK